MCRLGIYGLAALLWFAAPLGAFAQDIITTVAGTTWTLRGDAAPAINAPLGQVGGVVVDSAGNVFAADQGNNLVVKISPTGILTVVAGNGIRGFSGDGGQATSASLDFDPFPFFPSAAGVAVDAAENLYIADFSNNRIRKVSPEGIITTVAGNGSFGFSGDEGPATSASLGGPVGLAVDAEGNLYIADRFNNRIRKVSPGGVVSTVAGNGEEGFSGDGGPATSASLASPFGVAVDLTGNLYIADFGNSRVRMVSPDGIINTVAGGGTNFGDGILATSASLEGPLAVAVDATSTTLYIADGGGNQIQKVSLLAGTISRVAGEEFAAPGFGGDDGPATSALLQAPVGVAVDITGNLYVADFANNRLRKVSSDGIINTMAGNGQFKFAGDGGPASSASLHQPFGVGVNTVGDLYIADTFNERIRKVSASGVITTVAGSGVSGFFPEQEGGPATSARLNGPFDVVVDSAGDLYIADFANHRIRKVSPDGIITTVAGDGVRRFSGDGGPATSASLALPSAVAVDSVGNLYIADTDNNRIRRVSPDGTITTVAGNDCRNPGIGGGAFLAMVVRPTAPL